MTEEELVTLIRDNKALVIGAIGKYLYSECSEYAEDVFQEVWYRAYRALKNDRFRGDSKPGTWLYTIARNESLRQNEKCARIKERLLAKEPEQSVAGHEESILEKMSFDTILQKLPEIYRSVVQFRVEGFAVQEIAQRMGIREGTVKSRLSRARDLVAKMEGVK